MLELSWKDVSQWNYLIDNKSDEPRTVVIEHPRQDQWKLAEPAKADETTDSLYRFERKLKAGQVLKYPVRTEMQRPEEVRLLDVAPDRLDVYVKLSNVPQDVRDALAQVIAGKRALADTSRQISEQTRRIAEISSEQSRIRENMKAVAASTDYYARMVKKLDDQETQIESMQKQIESLQKQSESQRKDLENKISGLTIGA